MTVITRTPAAQMLDEVDAYVKLHRHSDRSFVRDVLAGRATLQGLKRWAIQKYHQVYEQNRVFSANHSNAHSEDIRQFMVDQLIAEETEIRDGSAAHYVLMERFAIAVGATREEILSTTPAPEVMRFVNFLLSLARRNPLECMLAQYINESQSYQGAALLYKHLKEQYAFSDEVLEWFIVHGTVDVDHASRGRRLIERHAKPDYIDNALSLAKEACAEWLLLHDYYATVVNTAA